METDEIIYRKIAEMLQQQIGLNPDSVGPRAISRAVKQEMRIAKQLDLADYWLALQASTDRLSALIEAVVVLETSFFRNRDSFTFLRQWVSQEWPRQRCLRVLSLGCSTGEEPYSTAITLLEEGLTFDQFQIDAVDISAQALEKAKRGIYSPYAFRRQTYRSDDQYFTLGIPEGVSQGKRATQRYFLAAAVREQVNFYQGNAIDPQLLADQPPYDVVFCCNLLASFDRVARDRAIAKLDQLLLPNGLLFLGNTEMKLIDASHYQIVPYPQTYAYRKIADAAQLEIPVSEHQGLSTR
mgnify:CR=1 FL=1